MPQFVSSGDTITVPGASMWAKYFGGTAVVGLCLATPAGIILLMALGLPTNPIFLVGAAICAVVGLIFAVSAQCDDGEIARGGPPDDDY